ncbi:hypothetical protein PCE1_000260 [Barthelona sp. PCE]
MRSVLPVSVYDLYQLPKTKRRIISTVSLIALVFFLFLSVGVISFIFKTRYDTISSQKTFTSEEIDRIVVQAGFARVVVIPHDTNDVVVGVSKLMLVHKTHKRKSISTLYVSQGKTHKHSSVELYVPRHKVLDLLKIVVDKGSVVLRKGVHAKTANIVGQKTKITVKGADVDDLLVRTLSGNIEVRESTANNMADVHSTFGTINALHMTGSDLSASTATGNIVVKLHTDVEFTYDILSKKGVVENKGFSMSSQVGATMHNEAETAMNVNVRTIMGDIYIAKTTTPSYHFFPSIVMAEL